MKEFLNSDEPNFIFKGVNALVDMGCIIEKEIPDIQARPNIDEISVVGRSGTLTEWHGDYEPYDLDVGKISILYANLEEVRRWLTGSGELITHNDYGKFIEAIPDFSLARKYENEWGYFYTFDLTFRCQPLKRKVNEQPLLLNRASQTFFNPGSIKSFPKIEFYNAQNVYFKLVCNHVELTLPHLGKGAVTIDCEKGMAIQGGEIVRSVGEWPEIYPGENEVSIYGDYLDAKLFMRSLWL